MKKNEKDEKYSLATIAHEINNPAHSILMNAQSQKKIWKSIFNILDELVKEKLVIGDYDYEELKQDLLTSIETTIKNSLRIKRVLAEIDKASHKK